MRFYNSKEIGGRIREFRQKKSISQERLAELLDMSPQQVQKYEAGTSRLNTDKLQRLADALGITIYSLFESDTDTPFVLTPDEIRLISAYRAIKAQAVKDGFLVCIEHASQK
jgi:transcriptional regulator with XRE-family HTH domain